MARRLVDPGSLRLGHMPAVEETVHATLRRDLYGRRVPEPCDDDCAVASPALARRRALGHPPVVPGDAYVVEGNVPAADHVHGLEAELPELTGGEGALETDVGHPRPATTPQADRPQPAAPRGVPAARASERVSRRGLPHSDRDRPA
ncbi:hypothetical protein SRB17_23520 [Streptomyces sp. RB17]|nr:hypothetical protein [Streptomyces sp. RB17]